jgi:hypothetical protein
MDPQIEGEISERLLGPATDVVNDVEQQQLPPFATNGGIKLSSQFPTPSVRDGGAADEFVVDASSLMGHQNSNPTGTEAQQPEYRDAPFAIAFLLHILVIVFISFSWGVSAIKQSNPINTDGNNNNGGSSNLSGLLWLCFFTCLCSIGISAISLQVMTHHAETLIQSSLIASCGFMAFFVIGFFMDGVTTIGILWLLVLAITICYAYTVWYRIPFAAANLRTALSAIETNAGVCILGYGVAFLANIWVVIWFLAFIGVSFKESSCSNGVCESTNMNGISILLLLVSYHWTSQVIKNVLHVTVSGVVGTWWFAPQDYLSVFSPAIVDSFSRATTYSFGSICMGSLLVAIIQTLENLARNARRHDRGGIITCIRKYRRIERVFA